MGIISDYIKKAKVRDKEKRKEEIISGCVSCVVDSRFTPLEQAELVNQVVLRFFDRTKEGRQTHIAEARAYQNGIEKLNLDLKNG